MVIRLKDGSGFETYNSSNIVLTVISNRLYLSYLDQFRIPRMVEAGKVKQFEP